MNLLPLLGLAAGLVIGDRRAFIATFLLGAVGLTLVAILTDEIDGWFDPYAWGLMLISLATTFAGIRGRRWFSSRRMRYPAGTVKRDESSPPSR